jgi:hypothetical protein
MSKKRGSGTQESGGEVRRQSSAGDEAAEDQNGRRVRQTSVRSRRLCVKAERRAVQTIRVRRNAPAHKSGIAYPDAKKQRANAAGQEICRWRATDPRPRGHVFKYKLSPEKSSGLSRIRNPSRQTADTVAEGMLQSLKIKRRLCRFGL